MNKIKPHKIETIYLLILFIMCIFASVENYIILQKDQTQLSYDMMDSFSYSNSLYHSIKKANLKTFSHIYFNKLYKNYPPFIILQPIPFYFFLNNTQDIASFSNIIHIFILTYSLYFFGKKMFNIDVGFLAAFLSFFIIGLRAFSRVYLPAFALSSSIMLSITLFIYSNTSKKSKFSILFGFSLGIGMLIKWTFFIYIIPMIILILFSDLFKSQFKINKHQIKNIMLTILSFCILTLHWYSTNFFRMISYFKIIHKELLKTSLNSNFFF